MAGFQFFCGWFEGIILPGLGRKKRFIENDNEIVFEIFRYTSAVDVYKRQLKE